ncbi:RagB/SusD family nutrient uptake outer membrane protein [Compostibacter hankyongensis]
MNRHIAGCLLLGFILAVCISCDKMLDKPPLDQITDEQLNFTATEMKLYSNQFYPDFPGWFPGAYTGGIFWLDNATDNMVHGNYNYNAQISGTGTVSASGGGWDWTDIRAVNYFLANYHKSPDAPALTDTYVGEMYFWRAWFYFKLLRQFGDLPWYSRPLTTEDEEALQAPRLKRNIIVDSILNDLDSAVNLLAAPSQAEALRINRGVALAFTSRVALYEGTWEKYHNGTPFGVENADYNKYLRKAADAALTLINAGYYQIASIADDPKFGYWRLFNQQDLSNNPEIILWKKFDKSLGLTHFGQNMLAYGGNNTGLTKQLVDAYLCTDGKPIAVSKAYKGDNTLEDQVTNRDPRLAQTILLPGYPRIITGGDTTGKFILPDINMPGDGRCTTGFEPFKGIAPDDADGTGSATASIIFRYAEVLLNYAEAKVELGEGTQEVLDKTVNVLRDRVGMPRLTADVGFTDPNWEFKNLSPLLNEVRRERRVELAIEGYRFDDLMRWAATALIKQPLYGARYSQFVGKPFNPPLSNIPVSADGYIFPLKNTPAAQGWQFNPGRDYLLPIPSDELVLNKHLTQNPGW